ncbi:hypothetical protein E4U43_003918 [Claviceps pusilla]|uniref:NAD(P)-binding domain-containing protein n=1 Tax=Claviceps pusilla TaxID=123648 RepID=A0A9P7NG85_9HYPO|nr:hypothetical protein E4U43_003918 [Claviceps pusilla]
MASYAVVGATGNCGTALIQLLLQRPDASIHAFCRNKSKLIRLVPEIEHRNHVTIYQGSVQDTELLTPCLRGRSAIFMVLSSNINEPGFRAGQDANAAVVEVLRYLHRSNGAQLAATAPPRIILLSSATLDDTLSQKTPSLLRQVLHLSASHVYNDLVETEKLLRAEQDWLTTVFVKPGALSVDKQRGHALSFVESENPVSYLDLAAAMLEVADDTTGKYDMKNVGVINTNGAASFPTGTPLCIATGLLRHFWPSLHPYLP